MQLMKTEINVAMPHTIRLLRKLTRKPILTNKST